MSFDQDRTLQGDDTTIDTVSPRQAMKEYQGWSMFQAAIALIDLGDFKTAPQERDSDAQTTGTVESWLKSINSSLPDQPGTAATTPAPSSCGEAVNGKEGFVESAYHLCTDCSIQHESFEHPGEVGAFHAYPIPGNESKPLFPTGALTVESAYSQDGSLDVAPKSRRPNAADVQELEIEVYGNDPGKDMRKPPELSDSGSFASWDFPLFPPDGPLSGIGEMTPYGCTCCPGPIPARQPDHQRSATESELCKLQKDL